MFRELVGRAGPGYVPHLIYTTGCSVYGPHHHRVLTEDTLGDATNSRFQLEQKLRTAPLPFTTMRPAFVYGRDNRSSILGRWLTNARDGTAVFYGDPHKTWSWVHVDDVAAAFSAVVGRLPLTAGDTFLLADSHPAMAVDTFTACW